MRVTVASSISEMQSHSTLPLGVSRSRARWPMANCGCEPMPMSPGSCWRQALTWRTRRASSVVQPWPASGTNWRSSWQTGQSGGGPALGGYCMPHAVQM